MIDWALILLMFFVGAVCGVIYAFSKIALIIIWLIDVIYTIIMISDRIKKDIPVFDFSVWTFILATLTFVLGMLAGIKIGEILKEEISKLWKKIKK